MATINMQPGSCIECGVSVEAQAGALYRHSGANLFAHGKRLKRSRYSPYTYVGRCRACADTRTDSPYAQPAAGDPGWGGSPGYSEACGVWN